MKDSVFSNHWNPRLYIENAVEPKEESWFSVEYDEKGKATVIEKRRCKGVFLESLELKHFPFDTQVCRSDHLCVFFGILSFLSLLENEHAHCPVGGSVWWC